MGYFVTNEVLIDNNLAWGRGQFHSLVHVLCHFISLVHFLRLRS